MSNSIVIETRLSIKIIAGLAQYYPEARSKSDLLRLTLIELHDLLAYHKKIQRFADTTKAQEYLCQRGFEGNKKGRKALAEEIDADFLKDKA